MSSALRVGVALAATPLGALAGLHRVHVQASTCVSLLRPLADRMRPATIAEFAGQAHLVGQGKALRAALDRGQPHSMILWGPPGTGKTTLARIIASTMDAEFVALVRRDIGREGNPRRS